MSAQPPPNALAANGAMAAALAAAGITAGAPPPPLPPLPMPVQAAAAQMKRNNASDGPAAKKKKAAKADRAAATNDAARAWAARTAATLKANMQPYVIRAKPLGERYWREVRLPRGSGVKQLVELLAAKLGVDAHAIEAAVLLPNVDITDDASVGRLQEGSEIVVHLASSARSGRGGGARAVSGKARGKS